MKVTVLSRPGCHLCDEAISDLSRHLGERDRPGSPFEVEVIDIESDDELHRRYLERIPVIMIEGETVSEFVFDSVAFEAALARQPRSAG